MFQFLADRYDPLIVVTDQLDPVEMNIDRIALRWSMAVELEAPALKPYAPLADRLIQWSPFAEDLVYATTSYLSYLYERQIPKVWMIGETDEMLETATKSLHTFQFPVWRQQLLGTLECEEGDVLINSWLTEAAALPTMNAADGVTPLRPLVVVLLVDDMSLAIKLFDRFAALSSGRDAVRKLLVVCPWRIGLVYEAFQALRDTSSMFPSTSAVIFPSPFPAFWLPYSPINIEMRSILRTTDASALENPYVINGVLATRMVHSVSSYLKFGEASPTNFLKILYTVKTFSLLGVNIGPFYNDPCDNSTVKRNDPRRTCQCNVAFHRQYVFDVLDWAAAREPTSTQAYVVDQQGCGPLYRPLIIVVPPSTLSMSSIAGIAVGSGAGLLLLLAAVYYCTLAGRGRDVRRAPKNPNKPCAILFTDSELDVAVGPIPDRDERSRRAASPYYSGSPGQAQWLRSENHWR